MTRTQSKAVGNCYQDAFELVYNHPGTDAVLAHGTCTGKGPIEGVAFGHAWMILGPLVFTVVNGKVHVVAKDVYYQAGACRKVKTYTRHEMLIMALRHKHYGPWDRDTKKAAHHKNKPLTRNKGVDRLHADRKNRP